MTDDVMKELVTKHDATITQLVSSVEHLVSSQTETNKRLEEISRFLAKQAVFGNKLENMDRDLQESFIRVYKKIDAVEHLQQTDDGCQSVKLLSKEVSTIAKSVNRLIDKSDIQQDKLDELEIYKAESISPNTIRWIVGVVTAYTVMFGIYIVQSINSLNVTNKHINTLLARDIKDTDKLMKMVYDGTYTIRRNYDGKRKE